MGMANVLQSIKDAEDAADAKIAASKEEAAKIIADAKEAMKSSKTLRMERSVRPQRRLLGTKQAGKEAEGVQAGGAKSLKNTIFSRRSPEAAVQLVIDSLMSN